METTESVHHVDGALDGASNVIRLTPKQELFAREYLIDLNATQAAIRAGYSRKTAAQMGAENLIKPVIAAAIAVKARERLAKADLTAERVLEEIRRLAFSDIGDLLDNDGTPKPLSALSPEQSAAISSYEVVLKNAEAGDGHTDRVLKVRMWDKLKALELLCRHLRLFEPEGQPPVKLQQLVIRIERPPAGAQVPLSPQKTLQ